MKILNDLVRAARTIRFLNRRQAVGQVRHRLGGPAQRPKRPLASGLQDVRLGARVAPPSTDGRVQPDGAVVLLDSSPYDPLRDGWRTARDPLWTYTLHYQGWLTQLSADDAEATALSWIAEHRRGVGWEPYPTSVRLLHWLGWLQREGGQRQAGPRERMLASMAAQLEHLAANLEEHIDGNHLWSNLAALTACGLGLRGPLADSLRRRFAPRFAEVVQEQLYGDGVHRERTPSYHCLLAEQLAIVTELARDADPSLHAKLRPKVVAMLAATAAFTHPDGDVALFGDSQRDATVTPVKLLQRDGASVNPHDALCPEGGFIRRRWGDWTVLWTVGGAGLPWQTGHAHGDALAVELSLGDERVIVDAGVGTYVRGTSRTYARSTRAHNTATVGFGEPDQHELWASHRVGRRADPQLQTAERDTLAARVHGVFSPGVHERTLSRVDNAIVVYDGVQPWGPATVRWFVPGDAQVDVQGSNATVTTAGGTRFSIITNADALIETQTHGWHAIGRPVPRTCLAAPIPTTGLTTRFERE